MADPERFGRYQLIRLVGSGGMAEIHLAHQVGPQGFVKPCVLKRIAPEHRQDTTVRTMFLDEARLSALLNHPHIVQTFDFGEEAGVPFMALELVDGVNLAQLLRIVANNQRWVPLRASLEIAIAIGEALSYAHTLRDLDGGRELNVVHRDVSPQNILISRIGTVKLADFGIARHAARAQKTIGPSTKGKPGYMAPEQALTAEVDGRSDIFSLGIVLGELLSARRVVRSMTDLLSLPKRMSELLNLQPGCPANLRETILAMTAIEPNQRPRSAREVVSALREALSGIPDTGGISYFVQNVVESFFPSDPEGKPFAMIGDSDLDFEAVAQRSSGPSKGATADPPLPTPPVADSSDLAFVKSEWAEVEAEPTASGAVYGGWPAEYLDPPAPLPKRIEIPKPEASSDLVTHSSSVEAMRFFGAQGSSQPSADEKEVAASKPSRQRPVSSVGAEGSPVIFGASPSDLSARGMPKALSGLVDEKDTSRDEEARKKKLSSYLFTVVAAIVLGGLGLGILSLVSTSTLSLHMPGSQKVGTLSIASDMPGARIWIGGVETPAVTPAEIPNLPVDQAVRVSVRMPGFLSIPQEVPVIIPASTLKTSVNFTLKRSRSFRLETVPDSATVTMNGRQLAEVTPLTLPAIVLGATATLSLSLIGYLPAKLHIKAGTETATVATLKLEAGKEIDVVSEPPGAKVLIDGQERGITPVYDLLVPESRRFGLKVVKGGFKTHAVALTAAKMRDRLIEVDLEPVPLLKMPMSKAERIEATDWDRRLTRLTGDLRRAKTRLAAAEKQLEVAEASPDFFVGKLTVAQREVDQARTRVEELETELSDVESHIEAFRQRVMNRIEGTND